MAINPENSISLCTGRNTLFHKLGLNAYAPDCTCFLPRPCVLEQNLSSQYPDGNGYIIELERGQLH